MKKILIVVTISLVMNSGVAQIMQQYTEEQITQLLKKQQECWNNGDIECFMHEYWHSDSLMFIGKSGITYGWQNTLNGYKKRYPDKESMGSLVFEVIKIESLSNTQVQVIGKWTLIRVRDTLTGYFTLLWTKINGEWKIVLDHSS